MKPVDVLVHVSERPDNIAQENIIGALFQLPGVAMARFNMDKPNLLFVSYNPEAISSSDIIGEIRKAGHSGHLVGL